MSSQLPLPFALRPNRSAHPGTIDMPRARRTTQQVQAEQVAKDKERLTQAQSRKKTIQKTAQVEANMRQTHEEKRRHAHNPPPVTIERVHRSRPLSDKDNLGHIEPDNTQEGGKVPDGNGEGEGVKGQELEEGDDNTIGADDNGTSEDETHDQALDPSDDEQPKKRKQASKRGELREQIQYAVGLAVDPPPTVKQRNRKRKAPVEEPHQKSQSKKQKNRIKGGLSKNWKERLAPPAQLLPDNGSIGANISNEFSRSSLSLPEADPAASVSTSCRSRPTWVDSDEELGGLSEHEGDTEGDNDERDAINAIGASTRPAYHVGTVKNPARSLQRSYAQIIPTTSVATFASPILDLPRAREKIHLGHLPHHLVTRFNGVFCPHLRAIFGATTPWEAPADEDIKHAWATVFPKECALDFGTPLGIIIHKLIIDRLSSWRHGIGNAGLLALQAKVFPNLPAGGIVNNHTSQVRSKWCTWAVSRTEADHPLYFLDVTEDADGNIESQSGIFQSKIISAILGYHINSIAPLRINAKTDRPIGALVLAIQSAKRAVTFHTTGVICKPPRPAADFSKANWGDHTKYDADGHPTSVYPTSVLVHLINQLKPKQWEKILSAATEESKVNLNTENIPFASTMPNPSISQNRPKPQLRDDDSDISTE
ncbi:hypothetical protein BJY52DRAFT_1189914 [Lactarius psammicola]|nr:hypothetical protein BJY52DRAFT_1189914 [Lactarius psammicola]